jgi:hypothetical protein
MYWIGHRHCDRSHHLPSAAATATISLGYFKIDCSQSCLQNLPAQASLIELERFRALAVEIQIRIQLRAGRY